MQAETLFLLQLLEAGLIAFGLAALALIVWYWPHGL